MCIWQYASGHVCAVLSKNAESAYRLLLSSCAVVDSKLLEMAYAGISNLNSPLHHKAALCVCTVHQRHLAEANRSLAIKYELSWCSHELNYASGC
jgi:hypothetical protein